MLRVGDTPTVKALQARPERGEQYETDGPHGS